MAALVGRFVSGHETLLEVWREADAAGMVLASDGRRTVIAPRTPPGFTRIHVNAGGQAWAVIPGHGAVSLCGQDQ